MTRYFLAAGLLSSVFSAGVWDICVIASDRANDTVSTVLQDWSLRFPILPLILGILLGHIFWPNTYQK